MGWLWGSNTPTSPSSTPTDADPLRDLDPNLRDFLDSETPPTQPAAPAPPPPPSPLATSDPAPKVPAESLYPDGRYAHLWSTYKSLQEVKDETQSDQEKLLEVFEGYKERKTEVERTALENCAMEQIAVDECFRTGGWKSRMTMCRAQQKAVERCYTTQHKFLQALGYLSTADRSRDEEIQMHADALYQRLLAQERAIDAAKAAGEAVPTFPSISSALSAQNASRRGVPPSPSSEPFSQLSDPTPLAKSEPPAIEDEGDPLSPTARAVLIERLNKLPTAEERELEELAVTVEARTRLRTGSEITRLSKAQKEHRKERREQGVATITDRISGWFGW